jgi:ParB-like chromosome segregation protein Spo0J
VDGEASGLLTGHEKAAEWVHVDTLVPWAKNPRKNDHRVQEAVASLRRWGFQDPMVAWVSRDRLVCGHARVKAVRLILKDDPGHVFPGAPGPGFVPVRFTEFNSEAEADAYALRANNSIGEWDPEGLAEVLRDLEAQGTETAGLGWSEEEVARLLEGSQSSPPPWEPAEDQTDQFTEKFQVLVECPDEQAQATLLQRLAGEGYSCRSLIS